MDIADTLNVELLKKYRGKGPPEHPIISKAIMSRVKINTKEILEYNDCHFNDCTFTGKKPKILLYRCRLVECRFPMKMLDNCLQCLVFDTKDLNGFKVNKKRGLLYSITKEEIKTP